MVIGSSPHWTSFNLRNVFKLNFAPIPRLAKDIEDKKSQYEPSLVPGVEDIESAAIFDEHDFVPHFQRVAISGEDNSGVSTSCTHVMGDLC